MTGLFVLPDGSHFEQASMGGAPAVYRQPVTHPELQRLEGLNPAATHLEFARTTLYAPRRIWVYSRAVRPLGALIDNVWAEVPLFTERLRSPA
jgi:hypothetical protein